MPTTTDQPFMNYCRALAMLLRYGGSTFPNGSVVQSAVVSVFVTGLLAIVLGPYASAVLPGSGENAGVPKHPLLCLSRRWQRYIDKCRRSSSLGEACTRMSGGRNSQTASMARS